MRLRQQLDTRGIAGPVGPSTPVVLGAGRPSLPSISASAGRPGSSGHAGAPNVGHGPASLFGAAGEREREREREFTSSRGPGEFPSMRERERDGEHSRESCYCADGVLKSRSVRAESHSLCIPQALLRAASHPNRQSSPLSTPPHLPLVHPPPAPRSHRANSRLLCPLPPPPTAPCHQRPYRRGIPLLPLLLPQRAQAQVERARRWRRARRASSLIPRR